MEESYNEELQCLEEEHSAFLDKEKHLEKRLVDSAPKRLIRTAEEIIDFCRLLNHDLISLLSLLLKYRNRARGSIQYP